MIELENGHSYIDEMAAFGNPNVIEKTIELLSEDEEVKIGKDFIRLEKDGWDVFLHVDKGIKLSVQKGEDYIIETHLFYQNDSPLLFARLKTIYNRRKIVVDEEKNKKRKQLEDEFLNLEI